MKKTVGGFFTVGRKFKKEFRKQMRMIIIITLGFTIAFTWRQTAFDISQAIVNSLFNISGAATSSLLTSTFITIVSLLIIIITANLLKDDPKDRYN